MFISYLKIAFRNILRNKLSTTINIVGLAVGMSCFILISLWIQDELSFDKFHANKDELYLVTITHPNDVVDPNVPYALAPVLASEFPEIIDYSRIYEVGALMMCSFKYQRENGQQAMFYEYKVSLADSSFFSMFSFPFIHGSPDTALTNQNSLVISEETAKKYFGKLNPLGKKLTFNNQKDLMVTGVVRVPSNSVIQFDFLAPLEDKMLDDWNWRDPSFVLLDKSASLNDFRTKIEGSLNKNYPHPISGTFKVDILPVFKVHLYFGRMSYVYIFSVIAVFILFIACINYMNLVTACASSRAKEVGLRKVVGAKRAQLIHQFLVESLLMSVFSLFLAVFLAKMSLPVLNDLTTKQLVLFPTQNFYMYLFLLGLAILVGLVSGSYPALFLTSRRPVDTLKTAVYFRARRSLFRVVSVVGQFTISVLLIVCTTVVYKQLNYVQNRPLGFSTNYVIKIPFNASLSRDFASFKNELLHNPSIIHATTSQAVPYDEDYKTGGVDWDGKRASLVPNVRYSITDIDYIETFGMEIVEGRSFSRDFPSDKNNFIINEKAASYMGMEAPVGQRLKFWGREGRIIGVVKDFHHVSLHREIMPHVFTINPDLGNWVRFAFVKIHSANIPETVKYIKEISEKYSAGFPFEYNFLDEGLGALYQAEQKLGEIFSFFALLAIFISCLGIFGLLSFIAEQRTKEIGIRKVLGASFSGIVVLLSKEFSKWILLANIIAWPVAYYAMFRWLQSFAYRTDLSLTLFVFSGLLSLILAALPVGYQSFKAAVANPVDSLRYE
ncbi:ABC transporter permease [Acidobacteriota bacterium]